MSTDDTPAPAAGDQRGGLDKTRATVTSGPLVDLPDGRHLDVPGPADPQRPRPNEARDLPHSLDGVPPTCRPGWSRSVPLVHAGGCTVPELDEAITAATAAAVDYLQNTGGGGLRPHSHRVVDNRRPSPFSR